MSDPLTITPIRGRHKTMVHIQARRVDVDGRAWHLALCGVRISAPAPQAAYPYCRHCQQRFSVLLA